jgi:hypothetical protein
VSAANEWLATPARTIAANSLEICLVALVIVLHSYCCIFLEFWRRSSENRVRYLGDTLRKMPPATVPVQCRAPVVELGSWRLGAKPEGVAFLNEKDRIAAGRSWAYIPICSIPWRSCSFRSVKPIATGFFWRTTDVIIRVDFFSGQLP